jgi:hypothetical protein
VKAFRAELAKDTTDADKGWKELKRATESSRNWLYLLATQKLHEPEATPKK